MLGKNAILPRTTTEFTKLLLDQKGFADPGLLVLIGDASYSVLVHLLAVSVHASFPPSVALVQLRSVRCGQLSRVAGSRFRLLALRELIVPVSWQSAPANQRPDSSSDPVHSVKARGYVVFLRTGR